MILKMRSALLLLPAGLLIVVTFVVAVVLLWSPRLAVVKVGDKSRDG